VRRSSTQFPNCNEEREEHIRQRLRDAVQALRRSQFPERFLRRSDPETGEVPLPCIWPDIEREKGDIWWAEGGGLLPGTKTRVLPTRAEISAMEAALPLFYAIKDQRYRAAVFLKAWPCGFRRIGQKLGVSHTTARLWERLGIEEICQRSQIR
jgi:hypothetical protein